MKNRPEQPVEEIVERLAKIYAETTGYYVEFHKGLSSASSDKVRRGIRAVLAALPVRESVALKADDVEWVVNDIAELGVKIGNQFFWLYKGASLQYDGLHDEDGEGNRKPMRWRPVYKREFGECCHPVETLKAHGKTTLDDFPNAYGWEDDWRDMPLTKTTSIEGGK